MTVNIWPVLFIANIKIVLLMWWGRAKSFPHFVCDSPKWHLVRVQCLHLQRVLQLWTILHGFISIRFNATTYALYYSIFFYIRANEPDSQSEVKSSEASQILSGRTLRWSKQRVCCFPLWTSCLCEDSLAKQHRRTFSGAFALVSHADYKGVERWRVAVEKCAQHMTCSVC